VSRVVDASVASKWFFPEPGSAEAEALLTGTDPLLAPDLIVAEVCNVAWKRLRADEITLTHAIRAMAQIARMVDVLSPLADLAPRAIEIARALDHPAYDCFYLALAEREHTDLVTADDVLVRRVARTPWARHVRHLVTRGRRR
jgi:predicted nucleic acid-binding protein